jgi:hypothetical protein
MAKVAAIVNKFGENKWGFTNSRGEELAREYLVRYVQCWCRKDEGYVTNRASNMAYFTSDEFFAKCAARGVKTGSEVGHVAALDASRWVSGRYIKTAAQPEVEAAPNAGGYEGDEPAYE